MLLVASGWFVAIADVPAGAFWLGLLFVRATSTRRRGGLAEMIGRGGCFMHGFGTLGLIEYDGKFHDQITRR